MEDLLEPRTEVHAGPLHTPTNTNSQSQYFFFLPAVAASAMTAPGIQWVGFSFADIRNWPGLRQTQEPVAKFASNPT